MITDLHVHLRPDEPSATAARYFTPSNAERYREAAEAAGIDELGVSEHVHRFRQALDVWQHPFWRQNATDDLGAYCDFVRERTDLRLGIEADFVPGREDRMGTLLGAHPFDYVVGSVHFLGDRAVDHDGYDVWQGARSVEDVWRRYFQTLGEAARSGLFDILAHPDLVKVWGSRRPRPEGDLRRYYELAMSGIAESGICVEVSTAGLRKDVGETYPAPTLLEMCLEAGCPVTLSSDAHVPEDLGHRYPETIEWLQGMGVTELCTFAERRPRLEAIG
ncbi:MAG TPA: histidinol-phosphatase HisJ family protein [Solirubrobacteraceae bacterium]|jgi:histidinol-phosphatase (PHP family)|nr:histidinol-phosphatase HisJ family protein [Solirubrobacteraceae bacterium]